MAVRRRSVWKPYETAPARFASGDANASGLSGSVFASCMRRIFPERVSSSRSGSHGEAAYGWRARFLESLRTGRLQLVVLSSGLLSSIRNGRRRCGKMRSFFTEAVAPDAFLRRPPRALAAYGSAAQSGGYRFISCEFLAAGVARFNRIVHLGGGRARDLPQATVAHGRFWTRGEKHEFRRRFQYRAPVPGRLTPDADDIERRRKQLRV